MENELLTRRETAKIAHVHEHTIDNLMNLGKIGYVRIGARGKRIPRSEIDRFIAENMVSASGRRPSQRSSRPSSARTSRNN